MYANATRATRETAEQVQCYLQLCRVYETKLKQLLIKYSLFRWANRMRMGKKWENGEFKFILHNNSVDVQTLIHSLARSHTHKQVNREHSLDATAFNAVSSVAACIISLNAGAASRSYFLFSSILWSTEPINSNQSPAPSVYLPFKPTFIICHNSYLTSLHPADDASPPFIPFR